MSSSSRRPATGGDEPGSHSGARGTVAARNSSKRAATVSSEIDTPTTQLTAHYLRVRAISSGGMGRVELVLRREGRFERLYALKRMRPELLGDVSMRQMFIEEARVAGLIHHPNVVAVLDVGEDAAGPFLVMEFIDGVTVKDLATKAKVTGLRVPVQVCARIAAQAAAGLHSAHTLVGPGGASLQVVHRDVSPQNILVGYDGVARLTDFGVVKAEGREVHTSTGVLKGRIGYMAPECLRLHQPHGKADIFSLGVVLYELLSSERAYPGNDDLARARRILDDPPPDVGEKRRDVPVALNALLMLMLAKSPDERPSGAAAAKELLDIAELLAQEEGRQDVGEYVCETFANERITTQAETRRLLSELDGVTVASAAAAEHSTEPARSSFLLLRIGLVLAAIVAVAFVIALGGAETPAPPTVVLLPGPGVPALPGSAVPAAHARIHLAVTSEPPGAHVRVDGVERGTTPLDVEVPYSEREVEVLAELAGYLVVTQRLVLSDDQRMHFVMRAAPPASVTRRRSPRRRDSGRSESVTFGRLPE